MMRLFMSAGLFLSHIVCQLAQEVIVIAQIAHSGTIRSCFFQPVYERITTEKTTSGDQK